VDTVNGASIAQAQKVCLDFIAFSQLKLGGLYKMTRSVVGGVADGTGDNSVSPTVGAYVANFFKAVVALSSTAALPNPTSVLGAFGADEVPIAWVTVTGSSGAIKRAFNINSVTRDSQGVWTVQLNHSASANTDMAPVVTCIGTVPQLMSAQLLAVNQIKVFACGAFGGGTPTDTDFSLFVYSGT
jgi:hypothetical protein